MHRPRVAVTRIAHLPKKTARSLKIAAQLYQAIGKKMLKSKKTYLNGRIYLNKLEKGFSRKIPIDKTNLDADCISHFRIFNKKGYYKTRGYIETNIFKDGAEVPTNARRLF